jgi:hypothetical protein
MDNRIDDLEKMLVALCAHLDVEFKTIPKVTICAKRAKK